MAISENLGTIPKGDVIRATVFFLDADGYVTTPTVVTLTTRDPSGDQTNYTYVSTTTDIERGAGGSYYRDIQASEVGKWRLKWSGVITNLGTRVMEQDFDVAPSVIT